MKEIVLNQILPRIEKLIEHYLNFKRGNAADKKFYSIDERNQTWQIFNDNEKDLITKLVEQANIIKHANTLPSADDSYFSVIYGSLKAALEYMGTIDCHGGLFSGFYHSKLQDNLAYESKQIFSAVSQYEAERERRLAAAATTASPACMAQIEKSFQELQSRLQNEETNNAVLLAKVHCYEQELANALADHNYLIGKTLAHFGIATPAHPQQRSASAIPSHPSQQLVINPASAHGTSTSSVPQKPIDMGRDYINNYHYGYSSFWQSSPNIPRESLRNEATVKLCLTSILSNGFELGNAFGKGDCFFDSIAQSLNLREGKELFDVKSLRLLCDEYVKDPKNNWVAVANEKDGVDHNGYLVRIQFTAQEMEEKEKNKLNLGPAILGRARVEGRIFCKKFGIRLHVIMIQEDSAINRLLIDEKEEIKLLNQFIDLTDVNILHIVNHYNHYVPLIRISALQSLNRQPVPAKATKL